MHSPASRLPLLVTGITGVAGYNALHHFQRRFPGQVIGIRPVRSWGLRGEGIIALDAEDRSGMGTLFDQFRFGSVLNCVGNCALKSCELDPAMARRLNVDSAANIVANCNRYGCRLVHLSTDLVFSGTGAGNHVESDPTDPVTVYGSTMVAGEKLIHESAPATVLRISLPMGRSFNRHAGAIDWIQSRFRHHRPATLYFDEVRSCTYCDDLNRVFERFLGSDELGLFHAGGPRPITLYQIAQVVNRIGGFEPALLKGCPRIEAGPIPPRAGDVSMCSDKLIRVLGFEPFREWPVGDDIFPTDRDWHFRRDDAETGSTKRIAERLYQYPASIHYV
jgi:dTDP-4-dehydrorhamnose reductase